MTRRSSVCISELLANKKSPKGSFLGLGAALGLALGVATDNLGLEHSLGVAIGAAMEYIPRK